MSDSYSSNSRGERIDPATEDLQRNIETLLEVLAGSGSLIVNSIAGDTQKLSVIGNVVQGLDQPCRSCLLNVPSGNTGRIYLTLANRDATVDDWLVPEDVAIPISVTNVSKLRFYGGTDGDVIHVLWRN